MQQKQISSIMNKLYYVTIIWMIVMLVTCTPAHSQPISDATTGKILGSLSTGDTKIYGTWTSEMAITPKYDTVRAIMLVCDTLTDRPMNDMFRPDSGVVWLYRRPPTWWKLGYEVNEPYIITTNIGQTSIPGNIISYLDENKKPLSKNIFVWQSQTINK